MDGDSANANTPRIDERPWRDTTIPTKGGSSTVEDARCLPDDSKLCLTHQFNPESDADDRWETCRLCQANAERHEEERRQAQLQRRQAKLSELQIGKRFIDCTWDDYKPVNKKAAHHKDVLMRYANGFGQALKHGASGMLIGNPGTGKNMLAALVCKTIFEQGHTFLHTTVARLIREVRATWKQGATKTERQALAEFSFPELLVVDEVGVQAGTDNEINILTEVINDRYEAVLPTMVISNLTFDKLETLLGPRIIDRLYDGGGFLLQFDWASYRRR